MSKLCERPGCSNKGAAEYGMIPEDLLFWIAPISAAPSDDRNVLCGRHADAMSVPRGWTLDDRREDVPRLFMAGRFESGDSAAPRAKRSRRTAPSEPAEQLVIDGTGEIDQPDLADAEDAEDAEADVVTGGGDVREPEAPWEPSFDHDDDLDGLLEVSSPLLSRAFRGADRRTS
ncbi:DUF3499 family protein [Ilumatobacter sp.]|uniref:DUF3499 family protein n=1 Tax=Ilumatobacter sp. TaxID=1967498 RepID=UPI003AF8D85D